MKSLLGTYAVQTRFYTRLHAVSSSIQSRPSRAASLANGRSTTTVPDRGAILMASKYGQRGTGPRERVCPPFLSKRHANYHAKVMCPWWSTWLRGEGNPRDRKVLTCQEMHGRTLEASHTLQGRSMEGPKKAERKLRRSKAQESVCTMNFPQKRHANALSLTVAARRATNCANMGGVRILVHGAPFRFAGGEK